MKNLKFLLLFSITITLLSLGIYACEKDKNIIKGQEFNVPELAATDRDAPDGFTSFNLAFPVGTQIELSGSELKFTLPQSHYILGLGVDGNFYRSQGGGSGGVTCKCTEGSGCDPIKNGDDYGCLMKDNCSKCEKSKAKIAGVDTDMTEIIIMSSEYKMDIDNYTELNGKYLLPSSFIQAPEFKNNLIDLQRIFASSESMDRKVILSNMYGYIVPIEIPIDLDTRSIAFKRVIGGGGNDTGVKCSCKIAGKSCPKDSQFGVVWCNSDNCTECSMSGKIVNSDGVEKDLLVVAFNSWFVTLQKNFKL